MRRRGSRASVAQESTIRFERKAPAAVETNRGRSNDVQCISRDPVIREKIDVYSMYIISTLASVVAPSASVPHRAAVAAAVRARAEHARRRVAHDELGAACAPHPGPQAEPPPGMGGLQWEIPSQQADRPRPSGTKGQGATGRAYRRGSPAPRPGSPRAARAHGVTPRRGLPTCQVEPRSRANFGPLIELFTVHVLSQHLSERCGCANPSPVGDSSPPPLCSGGARLEAVAHGPQLLDDRRVQRVLERDNPCGEHVLGIS